MPKPTGKQANASRESLPPPKSEEEKILRVLKNLLKVVGSSYRKAEAAMGLSRGTLSRLFQGKAPLKLSHITGICRLADLDLGEFFRLAYPRPSSSLLSTYPETLADPRLPRHLDVFGDFFEPHPLNRLLRVSREAQEEEVRELLRVVCSSMTTARWVLWWLEDEARLSSLRSALRTGIGMSGGCLDPNG
jgi:transcriptional regulator with XRE-family HTH domain